MAQSKGYQTVAPIVCKKLQGIRVGGKTYGYGEAVADDCLSQRKRQALYTGGLVCHVWELDKPSEPVESIEEAAVSAAVSIDSPVVEDSAPEVDENEDEG